MKCSEVPWLPEIEDKQRELWRIGALVWDVKHGKGHVITEEAECSKESGEECGICGWQFHPHSFWKCECGKCVLMDHHVYLIGFIPDGEKGVKTLG